MDRVLINTPATISETWYQGDTIADPGTVTVTVTRDDGTQVATATAAGSGAAARTFQLTADHTAQLDRLTVTWASAAAGTLSTTVEVVGDFLFTIAEAKELVPSATPTRIAQVRTRVEQILENACGIAFVPRYERSTLNGDSTSLLRLGSPLLRRVRWASVGGTALATADLAALSTSTAGLVSGYRWTTGYGNVTVGYEHGMDRAPEPVRAAALDYARFLLTQDTSIDSRAERLVTDDGTLVFAGTGATPLPSVNQVIDAYRIPVLV